MLIILRLATIDDAKDLYAWRNDESSRIYSGNASEIPWLSHVSWLASRLERLSDEPFFIFTIGDLSIGMSRFDLYNESKDVFEISILINPDFRNLGYGSQILQISCDVIAEIFPNYVLTAKVHVGNMISRNLFTRLGFRQRSQAGDFIILEKLLNNRQ